MFHNHFSPRSIPDLSVQTDLIMKTDTQVYLNVCIHRRSLKCHWKNDFESNICDMNGRLATDANADGLFTHSIT